MARYEWYREGRVPSTPAGRHRLRLRRGEDHLRQDRLQGVDLPRRVLPDSAAEAKKSPQQRGAPSRVTTGGATPTPVQ